MKERQFKTRKARKQVTRLKRGKVYADQRIRMSSRPTPRPGITAIAMAMIASAFTRKNRRGK